MRRYLAKFTTGAGVGVPLLTPTAKWARASDGTSPGTPPVVTELNSTNAPGVYWFEAEPTEEIVVTLQGGGSPASEVVLTIGPLDNAAEELLGLSHKLYRVFGTGYDPAGRLLTAKIRIYRSAAEAALDSPVGSTANYLLEIDQTAAYDVLGNLAAFEMLPA